MTISSSAALPARSPMPLMVHSTCRAPPSMAGQRIGDRQAQIVVACAEKIALSAFGTRSRTARNMCAIFVGRRVAHRVGQVDGGGAGLDGGFDAAAQIIDGRAGASMADHSTSSTRLRACVTVAVMISSTSSSVLRIWCARWIGEVETKVWMRGRAAWRTASPARAISTEMARARPATVAFFTAWR